MKQERDSRVPDNVPLISVVIPTCNGSGTIGELLAALSVQTIQPGQILVVDSSSDDDTPVVAASYGADVISVARASFDHGGTRKFAAEQASGDIIVYFTQDVLPARRTLLEKLIAPLIERPEVGMSYGRQLPAFDADPIAAHLRFFNYPDASVVRSLADRHRFGLTTVFASNSCAAYRRDVLAEIGSFPNGLVFGEDMVVAAGMLKTGRSVAYAAEALVYHSHNHTLEEDFRRYFDIGVLHASNSWLLDEFGSAGSRGLAYLKSGISFLRQRRRSGLIGEFMVRIAVKWIGYRLGRLYRLYPLQLGVLMSKNRVWWMRRSANKVAGPDDRHV